MERRILKPQALLSSLLREVSRSFYRTLRILPGNIRPQISLAYLLARTTDTIADTELVPVQQRLGALDTLRSRIAGLTREPIELGELAGKQGSPAERVLLENCEQSLQLLKTQTAPDLQKVRDVLTIITSGQELDLRRFGGAATNHVIALETDSELEDYTYRVAGCVGEFWTKLCRAHVFPRAVLDEADLLVKAVAFGKGLQLVNVLRDLPVDLSHGRCYLPREALEPLGLAPEELLNPANEPRLRPLYSRYLDRADEYLKTGWLYTERLPRRCVRVRLACAWPLLIGLETLGLLRKNNVLLPNQRLKISRANVKRIIWQSVLFYPWPPAWRRLFFPPQTPRPTG